MIYLLQRRYEQVNYDEKEAFVVRAYSEKGARLLCSKQAGDESPSEWLDPTKSECTKINYMGPSKVILSSSKNG
jgi:hypothetical protein